MAPKVAKLYDIIPKTFCLPKEYSQFSQEFYREGEKVGPSKNIWIIKPIGKSRGRGITVINELSQVVYLEPVVISKYI
jgi:tubulin polyglutamylase TTLL5